MRVHDGCGLDITRPRMFYHESLQIRATTKILPPEKYPLYGICCMFNTEFCWLKKKNLIKKNVKKGIHSDIKCININGVLKLKLSRIDAITNYSTLEVN